VKTLPNSIGVQLVVIRGQQNNGKVQFFSKRFFPPDANFFVPTRWCFVDLTQIQSLRAGKYR